MRNIYNHENMKSLICLLFDQYAYAYAMLFESFIKPVNELS